MSETCQRKLCDNETRKTRQQRKYDCCYCSETFQTLSALKKHRRQHNEERKPNECEHCCKSFSTVSRLRIHLKLHTSNLLFNNQESEKTDLRRLGNTSENSKGSTQVGHRARNCKIKEDDEIWMFRDTATSELAHGDKNNEIFKNGVSVSHLAEHHSAAPQTKLCSFREDRDAPCGVNTKKEEFQPCLKKKSLLLCTECGKPFAHKLELDAHKEIHKQLHDIVVKRALLFIGDSI